MQNLSKENQRKMTCVVLTHSSLRFDEIISKYKLYSPEMVLWKPDFSIVTNREAKGIISLGDNLAKNLVAAATEDIHKVLSTWYFDENGNDVSVLDIQRSCCFIM